MTSLTYEVQDFCISLLEIHEIKKHESSFTIMYRRTEGSQPAYRSITFATPEEASLAYHDLREKWNEVLNHLVELGCLNTNTRFTKR
jgi:hypothetical protein